MTVNRCRSRQQSAIRDTFSSLDLRASRPFRFGERISSNRLSKLQLFNVTNLLGVSNVTIPVRHGSARKTWSPVTTAGGVFGSGGPRAFHFAREFNSNATRTEHFFKR